MSIVFKSPVVETVTFRLILIAETAAVNLMEIVVVETEPAV